MAALDLDAAAREAAGQSLERRPHRGRGRHQRVAVDHQHAMARQLLVPRRPQREPVADAGGQFVGAGDDVEQQRQVTCGARHRSDDDEVVVARQRRRAGRCMAAAGHQPERRLERHDAGEVRRHAQRAADVGTELQGHEARRQRGRRAARRAARRALEVPRVARDAVDRVVALPVVEHDRHVGLAEQDGTGPSGTRDDQRVVVGLEVLGLRDAPGGRQAGHVERLLHRHRHAEQRPLVAARQRRVGGPGGLSRTLEVAHDDGIDRGVAALDARDQVIGEFERREPPPAQALGELSRREVLERPGGTWRRAARDCGGGGGSTGGSRLAGGDTGPAATGQRRGPGQQRAACEVDGHRDLLRAPSLVADSSGVKPSFYGRLKLAR